MRESKDYRPFHALLRVMVLERGKLMEYAAPLELLNDPNSLFFALCKKTGAIEQLTETAQKEENERIRRNGGTVKTDASEDAEGGSNANS